MHARLAQQDVALEWVAGRGRLDAQRHHAGVRAGRRNR